MKIWLSDAGKRFNRDWIFRHCSYSFIAGPPYGITGPNGSGKSTLLQVISAAMDPSEGKINWQLDGREVAADNVFRHMSICAPYLDVIEEMTAAEFLQFHAQFKPLIPGYSVADIISTIGLGNAAGKQIRYYSSGMKQRIKLAQAFFSDTPLLLLDEPCTNLDESGYQLYYHLLKTLCRERIVIVCSNEERELSLCEERIDVIKYK